MGSNDRNQGIIMNYTKLTFLILLCAVSFVGCRKPQEPTNQRQTTELRVSEPNEPVLSDRNDPAGYTYNEDMDEHCWSVTSHPEARLAHGWVSFVETKSGLEIKEHVGCGFSGTPMDKPLKLVLQPAIKDDLLHLQIVRHYHNRSATIEGKTSYPQDASMAIKVHKQYNGLKPEYQVLWKADIQYEGKTVKSVAYLARLSPMGEPYDGFGKDELPKVEAALLKHER